MKNFESLGVSSELCEALMKTELMIPFELQRNIIPLISRSNNLLIESGPGAGTLISYVLPLLDKIAPGLESPKAIVITATQDTSSKLAEAASRLTASTSHRVSALGTNWASPETADIIFGTATELLAGIENARFSTQNISTLIVDRANSIESETDLDSLKELLGYVGNKPQKVIFSLPITDSIRKLVTQHVPKCLEMSTTSKLDIADRNQQTQKIHYLITPEEKQAILLGLIKQHSSDQFQHLMIFVHTSNSANELIASLRLYGFTVGHPGDPESFIWVGTESQKSYSREMIIQGQSIATISLDCPQDTLVMESCHIEATKAIVLILAREMPHFRQITSALSYDIQALQIKPGLRDDPLKKIRKHITHQITSTDLAPYYAILEPLLESYDPVELSAASLSLASLPPNNEETVNKGESLAASHDKNDWTRLFVSLGEIEGVTASTLLGALAGESGVDGDAFGKIEIRETFSLVEVRTTEAKKVIKTVNGTTIRGRSTRVDYDRSLKTNKPPRTIKRS